ncbi:MAG: ComEC/Rec2 family competence protein [Acidimicrobiia bacterium]|nr:ComEC/Rec2 family competence protein [Acidimicrobiia bacterium]
MTTPARRESTVERTPARPDSVRGALSTPGIEVFPVLLAAAVAGGAWLGDHLGAGSGHAALLGALVVAAVAFVAPRPARGVAVLVVALLLGGAASQRALDGLEHSPFASAVEERSDVAVEGTLVGDPDARRFSTRVVIRAERFRPSGDPDASWEPDGSVMPPWRSGGGRHLFVEAGPPTAGRLAQLEAGDHVELTGWLAPLSGYDLRYRRHHAVGRLAALDLVDFEGPSSPLLRLANPTRAALLRGLDPLPDPERGLVAGFLLGDRRSIPEPLLDDFRHAGLTHLLAVSGSNVAFVLALAMPLLRRLGSTGRVPAALLILAVFAAMTRFEPSVLRASTMAACSLAGVLLGRPVSASRALGYAVAVLVLLDPFLVFSVAFLLSVGASVGIVGLAAPIAARLPGPSLVTLPLGVTIAAQIGVTPVLLPVFGAVPLVSVPANLLSVPVAGPLTTAGLAAGVADVLLGEWVPIVGAVIRMPTLWGAWWIETVARLAAQFPAEIDPRGGWALLAATAGVGAAHRVRRARGLEGDRKGGGSRKGRR